MPRCGTVVRWSDGTETVCPVQVSDDKECYHHQKYFEQVELYGGQLAWKSSPAPSDRRQRFGREGDTYISSIYSPRRDEGRRIGTLEEDYIPVVVTR